MNNKKEYIEKLEKMFEENYNNLEDVIKYIRKYNIESAESLLKKIQHSQDMLFDTCSLVNKVIMHVSKNNTAYNKPSIRLCIYDMDFEEQINKAEQSLKEKYQHTSYLDETYDATRSLFGKNNPIGFHNSFFEDELDILLSRIIDQSKQDNDEDDGGTFYAIIK